MSPKERLYGEPSQECAKILGLAEKESKGYPAFAATLTYPVSWDKGVLHLRGCRLRRDDSGYVILDGGVTKGQENHRIWDSHSIEQFTRITRSNMPSYRR
jgi:hypothetical protein